MPIIPVIIAADIFIALFIFFSVIGSIRKKLRVGCWSNIYLFLAGGLMIASFVMIAISNEEINYAMPATLAGLGVLILVGILLLILDRGRDDYRPMYSRGILGIGTGVILLSGLFFVPIIPETILPIPTSTPISEGIQNTSVAANIIPTESQGSVSDTELSIQSPTNVYTPFPSPSPTRTRRAYVPPTITPTPAVPPVNKDCDALITTNLNMRAQPATDADIVAIIPEGRFVKITGRNLSSTWWQSEFEGTQGWLFGEFLTLDAICIAELDR